MPGPLRRRPRRLALLAPLAALSLTVAACGGSLSEDGGDGDGSDTVKIGLALPASGVYEPLGVDMTRGFELYLDQHDGKLGGKDVKIVKGDEGEGPDTGVPAVQKLVTQDRVSALVGIVNSATALGVKDIVSQAKVPLIVANAGADEVADGQPYVWRTSFTNGGVGEALGGEVAKELGKESVYVMAADYAAGHESVEGFKKSFQAAGGKIAGESFTPFGTTTDWQPFLSKAQNSGAKAVYVFYAGGEAVNFVKQYNAFGLHDKIQLYGAGFLTEGGVLAAQGDAAEGVRTSLHYSNLLDTAENKEFVEAYTAAYDGEQPTVYSVQAYDAAAVLDKALAEADGTSGEDIAKALDGVGEIDSPRGTWSFDENHNPDQPYFLREVQAVEGGFGNAVLNQLN
ncbi:MAG TPA: ABC transporter substrate-binding protein [Marmoricola sp.]|jgi:branched-chain amino acid transport system substrate-binding protein|nr:ABC transporter substrate-binding protein [Marmoricola sp.]